MRFNKTRKNLHRKDQTGGSLGDWAIHIPGTRKYREHKEKIYDEILETAKKMVKNIISKKEFSEKSMGVELSVKEDQSVLIMRLAMNVSELIKRKGDDLKRKGVDLVSSFDLYADKILEYSYRVHDQYAVAINNIFKIKKMEPAYDVSNYTDDLALQDYKDAMGEPVASTSRKRKSQRKSRSDRKSEKGKKTRGRK